MPFPAALRTDRAIELPRLLLAPAAVEQQPGELAVHPRLVGQQHDIERHPATGTTRIVASEPGAAFAPANEELVAIIRRMRPRGRKDDGVIAIPAQLAGIPLRPLAAP